MTTDAPATPEAATARLGELTADKAWSGKLLAGEPTTVGEFHALSRLAAAEPAPSPASVEEIAAAAAKANDAANLADFVKGTRDRFPVGDDVIQQIAEGRPVSAADRDLGISWLQQLATDKERSAKVLAGDTELRRQMFAASVLVSSPVKAGETAKPFTMADILKIGKGQDRDVRSQL
jgi:hypothetical protein